MQGISSRSCCAMLLTLPLLGPVPAMAQSSGVVVLRWSQAECLGRNAEAYIKQPGDPLLLFAGFCDDMNFAPTPEDIARATSQNAFEAGVIEFETAGGTQQIPKNPMAAAIVVSDVQLGCLARALSEIAVPKTLEIDGLGAVEVAEIDFGKCPD